MKKYIFGFFVFCMLPYFVLAQKDATELKTIDLVSVFEARSQPDLYGTNPGCFSFISETFNCYSSDLIYGHLRAGDDWDWFQVMGVGKRNKILNLGKFEWTDKFKIPVIEPYAPLKVGERRKITVDASGKKGRDGAPGRDGLPGADANDGGSRSEAATLANLREIIPDPPLPPPAVRPPASGKECTNQVVTKNKDDDYDPLHRAAPGNMYLLRVVDEVNDFYVLFRVDSLERGRKATISWKRIDAPKEK